LKNVYTVMHGQKNIKLSGDPVGTFIA